MRQSKVYLEGRVTDCQDRHVSAHALLGAARANLDATCQLKAPPGNLKEPALQPIGHIHAHKHNLSFCCYVEICCGRIRGNISLSD